MKMTRREFIQQGSAVGLGVALSATAAYGSILDVIAGGKPAILGGAPAFSEKSWPIWPRWNATEYEPRILAVLRSGVWSRAKVTAEFEEAWAQMIGTKRCLSVVNGTNALITTLANLGVGPGDKVIVPPYTFIASVMAILANGAMPVFADIDPETFQISPDAARKKISRQTKAILAVHIAGLPSDMAELMKIGRENNISVVEDACQAHLAEYDGRRVGSIGDAGCFSFQNSKNLAIGEGGAIVSDNESFMDRCYSYHNLGLPHGTSVGTVSSGSVMQGTKVRFSEYQAAIGLAMLDQLEAETELRHTNAAILTELLEDVPGVYPAKLYDKVTRGAYHLYPFRFVQEEFGPLTREQFITALAAEGVPSSSGYGTINNQPYLKETFASALYQRVYAEEQLNFERYIVENACPANDVICNEQAVWFTQNMLLTGREEMEAIAGAIRKIQRQAKEISKQVSSL